MVHILCNAFLNLQCKMCFKSAPKVIFSCSKMFHNKKKKRKKSYKINLVEKATQKYAGIFYLTSSNKLNFSVEIGTQNIHLSSYVGVIFLTHIKKKSFTIKMLVENSHECNIKDQIV